MNAFLVTVLLLAQAPDESAGAEPPQLNAISLELNGWNMPLVSSTAIIYERAITAHLSLAGGFMGEDISGMHAVPAPDYDVRQYTAGIRVLARWYPQGNAPFGLWLGPMGAVSVSGDSIVKTGLNPRTDALELVMYTAGALFGFKGQLPFGFVIQISGGMRADWARLRNFIFSGVNFGPTTDKWFVVSPVTYLGLGWAF